MSLDRAKKILVFTGDWTKRQPGLETGIHSREFEFPGINWPIQRRGGIRPCGLPGDKIETGSLPNLLYLMSAWSKDKIKTNYKNVRPSGWTATNAASNLPSFSHRRGISSCPQEKSSKTLGNARAWEDASGATVRCQACALASTLPSSGR
jgi:hypothetical protein